MTRKALGSVNRRARIHWQFNGAHFDVPFACTSGGEGSALTSLTHFTRKSSELSVCCTVRNVLRSENAWWTKRFEERLGMDLRNDCEVIWSYPARVEVCRMTPVSYLKLWDCSRRVLCLVWRFVHFLQSFVRILEKMNEALLILLEMSKKTWFRPELESAFKKFWHQRPAKYFYRSKDVRVWPPLASNILRPSSQSFGSDRKSLRASKTF